VRSLMDPIVADSIRALLASVFLIGALHKALRFPHFRASVTDYRLLPGALVPAAAAGLIAAEVAVGASLATQASAHRGAVAAIVLLIVTSAAVVVNLLRGRTQIDCGCGGLSGQPISWALVVRNLALIVLAGLVTLPVAARPIVWVDYGTLAAWTLTLLALYACVNRLLANSPAALSLKERMK